jgi:hypothetical protein
MSCRVVSCVCVVCVVCHDISAFIEIGKLLREKVAQYDDVVVGFLTDGTPTPHLPIPFPMECKTRA